MEYDNVSLGLVRKRDPFAGDEKDGLIEQKWKMTTKWWWLKAMHPPKRCVCVCVSVFKIMCFFFSFAIQTARSSFFSDNSFIFSVGDLLISLLLLILLFECMEINNCCRKMHTWTDVTNRFVIQPRMISITLSARCASFVLSMKWNRQIIISRERFELFFLSTRLRKLLYEHESDLNPQFVYLLSSDFILQ